MKSYRIGIIVVQSVRSEHEKLETLWVKSKQRVWLRNQPIDPAHIHIDGKGDEMISCDYSIGYYLRSLGHDVDFILPDELTLSRAKKCDLVFTIIWDLLESFHLSTSIQHKRFAKMMNSIPNLFPNIEYQNFIADKCLYYKEFAKSSNINVIPTRCIRLKEFKQNRDLLKFSQKLLDEFNRKGWENFIIKPVYGQESLDFYKFNSSEHPASFARKLELCFQRYQGIVAQKYIPDFDKTAPEFRCYFIGGKYEYSIVTRFTNESVRRPIEEGGTEFHPQFQKIKKMAKHVLNALPKIVVNGVQLPSMLNRIDLATTTSGDIYISEAEHVPSYYLQDSQKITDRDVGNQIVRILNIYSKASRIN